MSLAVFPPGPVSELLSSNSEWGTDNILPSHLNACEKLRKATITFVMSVYPSVRMEQLGFNQRDFNEIWYLNIFRESVEKIQVLLKSDEYA